MRFILVFLSFWLSASLAGAQTTPSETEVDLELFLAVDVSRSMSAEELELQRRGYAEALASKDVIAALRSGLLGRIAVTYVEWAGPGSQREVVPWTLVESEADATAIAQKLTAHFDGGMRRTSISGALTYATAAFENNGFKGLRRVIDISGDGPNNQGRPVLRARAEAIARGIVINGLPLMTQDALSSIWGIPDLDVYYTNCVIGGPGAFVVPVYGWSQFPEAVTRKLVLEIAGVAPAPRVIRAQAAPAYDCMIGEKMWEQNRSFFDIP
ncbi:MAG: DUF1194 domain-containing protein [Pseudomonadota bacterium]